jgi:hypothetical protein
VSYGVKVIYEVASNDIEENSVGYVCVIEKGEVELGRFRRVVESGKR